MLMGREYKIYSRFETAGLKIIAAKLVHGSPSRRRRKFYAVHKERPFFKDLVSNS
jgi:nucleoside-diphosphate kinase